MRVDLGKGHDLEIGGDLDEGHELEVADDLDVAADYYDDFGGDLENDLAHSDATVVGLDGNPEMSDDFEIADDLGNDDLVGVHEVADGFGNDDLEIADDLDVASDELVNDGDHSLAGNHLHELFAALQ